MQGHIVSGCKLVHVGNLKKIARVIRQDVMARWRHWLLITTLLHFKVHG
jgi:hypothetical protein